MSKSKLLGNSKKDNTLFDGFIIHSKFDECKDYTFDPYWINLLDKCAKNKFPDKMTYDSDEMTILIDMGHGIVKSYMLTPNPEQNFILLLRIFICDLGYKSSRYVSSISFEEFNKNKKMNCSSIKDEGRENLKTQNNTKTNIILNDNNINSSYSKNIQNESLTASNIKDNSCQTAPIHDKSHSGVEHSDEENEPKKYEIERKTKREKDQLILNYISDLTNKYKLSQSEIKILSATIDIGFQFKALKYENIEYENGIIKSISGLEFKENERTFCIPKNGFSNYNKFDKIQNNKYQTCIDKYIREKNSKN